MVESERVPRKGRFRASTKKLSGQVLDKDRMSISNQKWLNPGEYREKVEYVRVPKNCPDEYLSRVESVSVPRNGRIRASTGKR